MRVGLTTTSEAKEKETLRSSSRSQIPTSLIDGGNREWTTRRHAEARVQISTSFASGDLSTDVVWRGWSMVLDDDTPMVTLAPEIPRAPQLRNTLGNGVVLGLLASNGRSTE